MGARLRVRDRHAREQLERRVVLHLAVLDDAAVAVRGVLAQAHVRHHQQLLAGRADRADRLLHDAVVGVALGAERVLGRGQPEQDHAADPELLDLLSLARHLVDRQVVAAGQRRDLAPQPLAGRHEQRVDQVRGRERRLAHHRAQPLAAPQPPGPLGGKAHAAAILESATRPTAGLRGASRPELRSSLVVVPEEEQVRAALAAEDPAVLAPAAVHADPLEADRALLQRRLFLALLAVDADRGHGCGESIAPGPEPGRFRSMLANPGGGPASRAPVAV